MSALDVAALDIGSSTALMPVVHVAVAGDEDEARVLHYSRHTQYNIIVVEWLAIAQF